ncbi:hypothetical protein ACTXT7_008183 [Hymenolepis weldensis]
MTVAPSSSFAFSYTSHPSLRRHGSVFLYRFALSLFFICAPDWLVRFENNMRTGNKKERNLLALKL